MKKISTFICCLFTCLGISQPVFKTYSDAGFGHMIRTPANELVACGRTYSGSASQLWKLDADGNVIWSKTLSVSAGSYMKRISITNDNNYLVCGSTSLGQGTSRLIFIKVSTDGDILGSTFPDLPKMFHIDNVYQLPDQSFVAVGASGNFGTPNYAVARFDSTLTNTLSFTEHQVENDTFFTNWQTVHGSYLSPDKESIVSVCADGATGSSINSDSYVLKADINGQIIWKTKIDNGQNDQAKGITSLADNSTLVTGSTNIAYGATWDRMFLTKLDTNGEILWQQFFDSTGIGAPLIGINLMEMPNGDILVTGRKIGGPKDNILLLLTDANGIEKHRLLLERNNHEDYPWATVLLDNNTLAIAGYQDQFSFHKNLLVLLPFSLISATREVEVNSPLFEVFPNPFYSNITIQYENQSALKMPMELEIYSSTGSKIYSGAILNDLNFKNLPAGTYYFVLIDKTLSKSFVRSVIKQ